MPFNSKGGIKLLLIILHSDLFYTIHLRMSTLNLFVNKNFTFIFTQCLLMQPIYGLTLVPKMGILIIEICVRRINYYSYA
nr:MAG TPA_asm: hypothetical protein [Caudoviricetes sp.]DAU42751.1 MAG TPA: hypothetical protein [Caudoviricetes sp.]